MKKIEIEEFISLAREYPVLDVRSPGEYGHAHIPCAYNLPLFSDEERKVVGTAYKHEGKERAIKIGLDYFGVKMRKMVEEVEEIKLKIKNQKLKNLSSNAQTIDQLPTANCVLVHCWRGGMRSRAVAWLLDLYGFEVYILDGGYKVFRNWTLQQFEKPYSFKILGGYTGSGKTEVLKQLESEKQPVIDLEGIASHKGSAFGGLGQLKQPTQEMFENLLGLKLYSICNNAPADKPIWLEDESSRIGTVNLPPALWNTMRHSPVYFLDIPFQERLNYITEEYGKFEKKELMASVLRIQKRLGGQNTKDAISHILDGNNKESFEILLRYYDKYYTQGLEERKKINGLIYIIGCDSVDAKKNMRKLVAEKTIV